MGLQVQIRLLGVIAEETGKAFLPHLEDTARALVHLLAPPEELWDELYEVRVEIYRSWSTLIKIAANNGKADLAKDLCKQLIGNSIMAFSNTDEWVDCEAIMDNANGMAQCLEHCGANSKVRRIFAFGKLEILLKSSVWQFCLWGFCLLYCDISSGNFLFLIEIVFGFAGAGRKRRGSAGGLHLPVNRMFFWIIFISRKIS